MRDSAVEQLIFDLREAAKDLDDNTTRRAVADIVAHAASLAIIYGDMEIFDRGNDDESSPSPVIELQIGSLAISVNVSVY